MTRAEMARRGWDELDIILVSGDAFVDHPAFGVAAIARVLLAAGWRVGVIAQPRWSTTEDIARLGRPRLCFGITAGNVDSMVANHSPAGRGRRRDDYSPGGKPGLRPDRATTVYCNLLRRMFKDVPLIIGGIEASLRRLAHYDYWDDAVRRSILLDTRADILCYGMAEPAVVEVAARLARKAPLDGIPGTVVVRGSPPAVPHVLIPSFEQVSANKAAFNEAFRLWHREHANPQGKTVVQPHADRFVVQYPPSPPLAPAELDRSYDLPYTRLAHPSYRQPIPALEPVRFSITSHRGCFGSCTFCSLSAHQGRIIQWRSLNSIVREARLIAGLPGFKGHITDVGGPTSNMYSATCPQMRRGRVCPDRQCAFPRRCPSLKIDYDHQLAVLGAVRRVPGVRLVTIGTGIRFDLIEGDQGRRYLAEICRRHVSGQLRVAPEHVSPRVLYLMRKFAPGDYDLFRDRFREASRRARKEQYLVPYFISGFPGATARDALDLAEYIVKTERFAVRRVQQFTPLPMTAAAAMWHTGKDPFTGRAVPVARSEDEQRLQRALLQPFDPDNLAIAEKLLIKLGRRDLLRRLRGLKPRTATTPHVVPPPRQRKHGLT